MLRKCEAIAIEREALNVRSSGDGRKRVDAHFVLFHVRDGPDVYDWVCRFERPRGEYFPLPTHIRTVEDALAARGYTI